jgi:AraC-like DNA-binding protein
MKAQQDVWFPYSKPSTFIKCNFLHLTIYESKYLIKGSLSQHFNQSESFVRYIYRDHIGDNMEVGDESQYFLSTVSYTWLVIMRTFNIKVIGRYDKIFKDDNKKLQLVYKNIAYSSRFQFARVFSIERREETKGQIVVNVNSWLILKSRNQVMLIFPQMLLIIMQFKHGFTKEKLY